MNKITGLERQIRYKDRYNLYIDNEFVAGIGTETVAQFNLYLGKEIDCKLIEQLKSKDSYYKCLNKAFELLSIRPHSEKELKDKLFRKFDNYEVFQSIDRLKVLKYLDDKVFAKAWVESRQKTHGRNVIRLELSKKGIDKEIIEQVLSLEIVTKESEICAARELVAKKKFNNLTRDELLKKAGGYLARRGFGYDIIRRVLDENK